MLMRTNAVQQMAEILPTVIPAAFLAAGAPDRVLMGEPRNIALPDGPRTATRKGGLLDVESSI
jgi:hypothetical protein